MSQPILLDTGPSRKGAHRLQAILTCPALYGFTKRYRPQLGVFAHPASQTDRDPLIRGSMGHIALAHHYARLGCEQNGLPLDTYYDPHTAIDLLAHKFGPTGEKFKDLIHRAYNDYCSFFVVERQQVVAVERAVEVSIPDPSSPGVSHEFTQRWDLVTKDAGGRYWITDHKFVGKIERKTLQRYAMSIQFISMAWLGHHVFGDAYGGIMLNLVGVGNPGNTTFSFRRESPPPAPDAVRRFPATLAHAEKLAVSYEGIDAWDLPRVQSETVCMTPYGACSCIELCRWGKGHVTQDGETF